MSQENSLPPINFSEINSKNASFGTQNPDMSPNHPLRQAEAFRQLMTDEKPQIKGTPPREFIESIRNQGGSANEFVNMSSDGMITVDSRLKEMLNIVKGQSQKYYEVKLPSLGRFYNGENGPTNGIVHVRKMTAEEEGILATPSYIKSGVAMNMIFNKCLQEQYDSVNFLSVDRNCLLIWLRALTYGRDYEVELTCPFTNRRFTHTIDLDLEIDFCPDNFGPANLISKLPEAGFDFSYHFSTGMEEKKLYDYKERKHKFQNTFNKADDTLIYKTVLSIDNLGGLTEEGEITTLVKALTGGDIAYLRQLTGEPPFGVQTNLVITSPYNNEDFDIDLPLEANFFFPKKKKGGHSV